jgi:small subunit ribosomal protein S6
MNKYPYKCVIALDTGVVSSDADVLSGRIKQIVEAEKGSMSDIEKAGTRRLAFRVKGRADANHMIIHFDSTPTALREVETWLRLQPGVLRVMTTRRTALETLAAQQAAASGQSS